MTDRELLVLAAKAAGFTNLIHWVDENTDEDSHLYGFPCLCSDLCGKPYEINAWNPLVDDSDALRLAVHLGLEIYTGQDDSGKDEQYVGYSSAGQRIRYVYEPHGDDSYAATRRAIVRAAAEIGKNMK